MPLKTRSRFVLILLALGLIGPFALNFMVQAQSSDLSIEQMEALQQAWHVSGIRQAGLDWTQVDFDDSGWDTAVPGVFEDGASAARNEVYAWPNPDSEWIWARGGVTAYFRREFGLPRSLKNDDYLQEHLVVRVTANNDYRLYINGQLVQEDGSEDDDDWKQYDQLDITEYVQVGDNVIAIEAINTEDPKDYGLLFDAELVTIGSGGTITGPVVRTGGC